MLCARCARNVSRAARRLSRPNGLAAASTPSGSHHFSSSAVWQEMKPLSPNAAQTSQPQRERPAATSTAAAQPFSERDTPSPSGTSAPSKPARTAPRSKVASGTPLKGLNYFKNKDDPVALEDEKYPDWLWTVLDPKAQPAAGAKQEVDPRLFSKSANARRMANKRARKQAKEQGDDSASKVPIYEQSIDLAPNAEARQDLTRAMREKRRGDIKEANFLKEMN